MTVEQMREFLKDKNGNRRIVWAYTGEDISFEEIGLTVEEKPEQKGLFDE